MEAWIPLLQTLVWPITMLVLLLVFRRPLTRFVGSITTRVKSGAELQLGGPAGFSAKLIDRYEDLRSVDAERGHALGAGASASRGDLDGWLRERSRLYDDNRFVFLSHVIAPSNLPGQKFEVFVSLVGHRRAEKGYPSDLSDVTRAEFFLGRGWRNRIFTVKGEPGRPIGVRAHSYMPFLCLCRVHFQDGGTVILHRYLDFAMADLYPRSQTDAA
ncbi:hypothetical protein EXU48_14575 [Occultella glacieicola]|uniref:Prokaryotic YEATS domain-containing protein n=1 Tax=Occultella glacieicola TaxID=2518684 RepID=A0ABY2E2A5_9MICO|nr:pYEATS domain-containing protein [Occultella glacieicola]TDE92740.1 hypothetical protein EXU48_14575 [Occultella glacieicola]